MAHTVHLKAIISTYAKQFLIFDSEKKVVIIMPFCIAWLLWIYDVAGVNLFVKLNIEAVLGGVL